MQNQIQLSEAIAKGSEGKQQVMAAFSLEGGGVCAIKAAMDHLNMSYPELKAAYRGEFFNCPMSDQRECRNFRGRSVELVMHLNDEHGWSFGKIVDFLAKKGL